MDWHIWLLYLVAATGLSLTPGPTSLLALTHGALHGHRRTLWTVGGGALGFAVVIALSMLGIGALLQASASALLVLKWVGGAYLVWLGVQLWRAPPLQLSAVAGAPFPRRSQLFRQGLFAAVSNPKALLFFTDFFPQFIDPAAPQLPQFLILMATFVCFELFWLMFYASFAARLAPWLRVQGRAKMFNRVSGATFIVASGLLATVKRAGEKA